MLVTNQLPNMKILSQRDLAWSSKFLGSSKLTVGRYGCTTTCVSMLSDYFGCYKSPLELAGNAKNYTKDGLILWTNLTFAKMKFTLRANGRDDGMIQEALKNPNKAVMLQVNNGAHWVVALRKTLFGKSYIVADPWSGDRCDVIKRYHNITGMAFFAKA